MTQRLNTLKSMLEKQPEDTFLLYALGMEHRKVSEIPSAIACFDQVIALDPGYCYAYYQKGQTLESIGQRDAAIAVYRQGIDAARVKGDAHAADELSAALSQLEAT